MLFTDGLSFRLAFADEEIGSLEREAFDRGGKEELTRVSCATIGAVTLLAEGALSFLCGCLIVVSSSTSGTSVKLEG